VKLPVLPAVLAATGAVLLGGAGTAHATPAHGVQAPARSSTGAKALVLHDIKVTTATVCGADADARGGVLNRAYGRHARWIELDDDEDNGEGGAFDGIFP
jgi:hypothetical protein